MNPDVTYSEHSFANEPGIPKFPLNVLGCRISKERQAVDCTDFYRQRTERWTFPCITPSLGLEEIRRRVPEDVWPVSSGFAYHCFKSPHVAQRAGNNRIVMSFLSGFQHLVLDPSAKAVYDLPVDYNAQEYHYAATGSFAKDRTHFYTARWTFKDAASILRGEHEKISCQVICIDLQKLCLDVVAELLYVSDIHQVTLAGDDRYLVFTTFSANPRKLYPREKYLENPEGFRISHESGMPLSEMVTLDLSTGDSWQTLIPTPRPAHFEVDPFDSSLIYVSSHNAAYSTDGMILEGPAAMYKLRIKNGETAVEQSYEMPDTFRMTQHTPFVRDGRTMIALTNFPNKLDFVDAETMLRVRSVELFPCLPLDFSITGNVKCPSYPDMSLNVSPSRCGNYVVLQTTGDYQIYDVTADKLLEQRVPLFLQDGLTPIGHSRIEV